MNINLDDSVKISVKEGAGIERINIRYIRSNVPSKHSIQINFIRINIILNMMNLSANSDKKHQNLGGNESSYVCQISPSSGCSNRPKESYFFGQNPLPKYETYEEEKESALYKVKCIYI